MCTFDFLRIVMAVESSWEIADTPPIMVNLAWF